VKDYPVREVFFENARVRKEIKTIIFLGGSQGASAINAFALESAKKLEENNIKIIHQCGEYELDMCKKFYHDNSIDADVFAFSKNLEEKIQVADFAICRAGASTVWELTASKLPALYIPYPYAAGNHQYHNACFLVDKHVSLLCKQTDLEPKWIDKILETDISSMSEGLGAMIEKEGAKKIVDVIVG